MSPVFPSDYLGKTSCTLKDGCIPYTLNSDQPTLEPLSTETRDTQRARQWVPSGHTLQNASRHGYELVPYMPTWHVALLSKVLYSQYATCRYASTTGVVGGIRTAILCICVAYTSTAPVILVRPMRACAGNPMVPACIDIKLVLPPASDPNFGLHPAGCTTGQVVRTPYAVQALVARILGCTLYIKVLCIVDYFGFSH